MFSFRLIRYNKCMSPFEPVKLYSKSAIPLLRTPPKLKRVDAIGWFLLVIPGSAFSLGVWQIRRKQWKENLIRDLQNRTSRDPVNLPENLEEIEKLEYMPVHVKGEFLHDKELYLGPRSLLIKGDATTESSLVSSRTNTSQGYVVITPFKLKDREDIILINRGWVPAKCKDPRTRNNGQVKGIVDVIGVVRLNEIRPTFSLKNQEGSRTYFYRDLPNMAEVAGTAPIFLDATNDFDVPEGPIGGQTRISLRNEHLSYILTWFSLCGATSYLWYARFLK